MNLKELARTLGLSQTTVSRALNGYPEVSEKTRERIVRAAKAHNYRPSRRARSLATGRSRRVAIAAAVGDGEGLSDPLFCAFLSGAVEVLDRHGFDWVVRQPKLEPGESQIARLATDESLEGAILTAPLKEDRFFAAHAKSRFPVVVRGPFCSQNSSLSGVDYDHQLAMFSAVTSLVDSGHRQIALIAGQQDHLITQSQTSAYLRAMQMSGLQVTPGFLHFGPRTQQFGMRTVDALLHTRTAPTALVIGCSLIAAGVAAGLARLTSAGDGDMSYLFYDDGHSWLNASACVDSFASLTTPAAKLGREAATRLIQQISAPDTVPDVRLLAPGLVLNQALVTNERSSAATAEYAPSSRQASLS